MMKHPYKISSQQFNLPDQQISYQLYRKAYEGKPRRLVMLHGAGVAGQDTWAAIAMLVNQWDEILIPDQRGTGNTRYPNGEEYAFTVTELVNDIGSLVDHLGWWQFDLAGYSMGGMVALIYKQRYHDRVQKQYLLEAAVLDRPSWESTVDLRHQFSAAAEQLKQDQAETGIKAFLDTISPNRKITPQAELLTIQRLGARPIGFANALNCVTETINSIDREALVAAQGDVTSFIGGQSVDLMHQYQRDLAERLPNWHYFMVPGTDHSLPFQKPRQIARIMDAELLRFLA
ncbi:alpha/beta hydrolase [Amphritea sp. 2_MG-2023]|uniref:alpha/beta fold hydrolase n=1 Tax=Amphritea TaxID=515417 RepID=UPI001C070E97|nr:MULTISPECIES: alpha/beta hydrolase [Amphritea]MBU2966391.1 alpha/beta hydrolase [Amphritea atlantica]MDO6419829.1 alpha/beta hydrolase [Amphritea sp. 2_MG-2023]